MTIEIERPDWLVPGAKVVCYTTGGTGTFPAVAVRTVNTVANKSFTVIDEPGRFNIRDLARSTEPGSVWSRTRHVVPFESDQARSILLEMRQRQIVRKATEACKTWINSPTHANRLAAIAALQAVSDDE